MTATSSKTTTTALDRLLDRKEVEVVTCQSRGTIYSAVREGTFPEPVQVGKRRIAWRESDIAKWIAARPTGTREAGCSPTRARG